MLRNGFGLNKVLFSFQEYRQKHHLAIKIKGVEPYFYYLILLPLKIRDTPIKILFLLKISLFSTTIKILIFLKYPRSDIDYVYNSVLYFPT